MRQFTSSAGFIYHRRFAQDPKEAPVNREFFGIIICLCCAMTAFAQNKTPTAKPQSTLVDRVGDTGFIQLKAESFRSLDAKQQALGYWLSQAAIAIDPIIYDQLSAYALREKRLLEEIVAHPQGIDAETMKKITAYAKLFWANRGNHNENTSQKFVPDFTVEQFQQAAATAQKNGAFKTAYADLPPLPTEDALNKELGELKQ